MRFLNGKICNVSNVFRSACSGVSQKSCLLIQDSILSSVLNYQTSLVFRKFYKRKTKMALVPSPSNDKVL